MGKALKITKKIFSALLWVLLIFIIVSMAFLLIASRGGQVPFLNGVRLFNVMSGSMEDTLPVGSVIIVSEREIEELAEGDIITFISNDPLFYGEIVTHRIVEIADFQGSVMFITKGDANEDRDQAAAIPANVIGKVVFNIPLLGYVLNFIRTKLGYFLICLLPCMVILVIEVINLVRNILRHSDAKKAEGLLEKNKASEIDKEEKADQDERDSNSADKRVDCGYLQSGPPDDNISRDNNRPKK